MKKVRKLGEITADMEDLILEMVEVHDMQWGEILTLIHGYLQVHCPGAQEKYIKGGSPVYYYGPKENK